MVTVGDGIYEIKKKNVIFFTSLCWSLFCWYYLRVWPTPQSNKHAYIWQLKIVLLRCTRQMGKWTNLPSDFIGETEIIDEYHSPGRWFFSLDNESSFVAVIGSLLSGNDKSNGTQHQQRKSGKRKNPITMICTKCNEVEWGRPKMKWSK